MKLRHIIVFILLALASRESIAATDSISVVVDTSCSSWHVCVHNLKTGGSIASIKLLLDTIGGIIQPYQVSHNTRINRLYDPEGSGRIDLDKNINQTCFAIDVDSIDKNAFASVAVFDDKGVYKIIALSFTEFGYKYNIYDGVPNDIGTVKIGINFFHTCVFEFPSALKKPLLLEALVFSQNVSAFHIEAYAPTDGNPIPAGSNVVVQLGIHPQDTGVFYDTLICKTDCVTIRKPFKIIGGCGIIYARDADVGSVVLGKETEYYVEIENRGYSTLTVLNGLIYSNGEISLAPFSAPTLTLPITIGAKSTYYAKLTYKPTKLGIDSAIIFYKTGTPERYRNSIRDTVQIRGRGILPKLLWNKSEGRILADSASMQILNLTLTNNEKFAIDVKRFYISGEDSSEFSIFNSLIPLHNVSIVPNESDWFTIGFLPDMSKPISKRYENRHATLNIETEYYTITLPLIAGFGLNHVKHELALENFSFSPNPVNGQDATLSFTLAEPKQLAISIYDMLGREVISIPSQYYSSGSFSNIISTSKLGDGSYILRVSDGLLTRSISFRVVK